MTLKNELKSNKVRISNDNDFNDIKIVLKRLENDVDQIFQKKIEKNIINKLFIHPEHWFHFYFEWIHNNLKNTHSFSFYYFLFVTLYKKLFKTEQLEINILNPNIYKSDKFKDYLLGFSFNNNLNSSLIYKSIIFIKELSDKIDLKLVLNLFDQFLTDNTIPKTLQYLFKITQILLFLLSEAINSLFHLKCVDFFIINYLVEILTQTRINSTSNILKNDLIQYFSYLIDNKNIPQNINYYIRVKLIKYYHIDLLNDFVVYFLIIISTLIQRK